MDGLVKVKLARGPNQRAFTIRNTTELELLIEQHAINAMDIDNSSGTQQNHTPTQTRPTHTATVTPHVQAVLTDIAKTQPLNIAHSLAHAKDGTGNLNTSIELLVHEQNQHQQQQNTHTTNTTATPNIQTLTPAQQQPQTPGPQGEQT